MSVKPKQLETCIMIMDTTHRSAAMWFRCGGTFDYLFYYKFTDESVLKEFGKSLNNWKSLGGKVNCLKRPVRSALSPR